MEPVMRAVLNALPDIKDVLSLFGVCRETRSAIAAIGHGPPPLGIKMHRLSSLAPQRCCPEAHHLSYLVRANIAPFLVCYVACCGERCQTAVMSRSADNLMDALALLIDRGSGGTYGPTVMHECFQDLVKSWGDEQIQERARRCIEKLMAHDQAKWKRNFY
jgi:hypothetical protein